MAKNITPFNINNYNKFLIELDKSNNCINDAIKENSHSIVEDIHSIVEDDIIQDIDSIVQAINDKYDTEIIKVAVDEDKHILKYEQNNPNLFQEYGKKPQKSIKMPKTFVEINVEIQNIADILQLIDSYPCDPSIEYSVDMKALHNIKEPLQELNNMIGMKELKMSITGQLIYFIQKLHINADESGDFMHTVIYGPPGTGKTEVAKLMGKIYSKLGILTSGTFLKVTRSDLIAGYLGQTAIKTADVIKNALGGVLFIDEAYALGNSEKRDSFSKECIDTLCEALSDHKNDLMVIIAGYESELKECFFNYNPGLESRFTWRFKTDEYTGKDLHAIFDKKVVDIGWTIHAGNDVSHEWFDKNRESFPYFGRDIESFLAKTKISHSKRVFCKPITEKKCLTKQDLMGGFEIYLQNSDNKDKKEAKYFKNHLQSTLYS